MRAALAACVATLLLAGCYRSSLRRPHERDGGLGDAGRSAVDEVRDFLEARRAELCRRAIECERRSGEALWAEEHCHSGLYPSDDSLDAVRSGAARFDRLRADECLRVLREGTGCLDSYEDLWRCYDVFAGALTPGALCDPHEDHCGEGLRCEPESCACEPVTPIGGSCWNECESGCSDGRCRARAGEGEPCGWCATGLRCAWWLEEPLCAADRCSPPP